MDFQNWEHIPIHCSKPNKKGAQMVLVVVELPNTIGPKIQECLGSVLEWVE